ncbi:MAG: CPBP family intramembrane metalloprotease [Solobacterium sp.]|nr:CPBP family intramembrane metalloprotease [Solobacterium sp.]
MTDRETGKRRGTAMNNRIIWIVPVFFALFLFGGGFLVIALETLPLPYDKLSGSMYFIISYYVIPFLPLFLLALLILAGIKKNRFIFAKLLPSYKGNKFKKFLAGLAIGFLMNTVCVTAAVIHQDIRLSYDFSLTEIPFMVFAFICICLQSSTEEIWCRGFLQERINIHYSFPAAAIVSSLAFGLLHAFNPGITPLALVNLILTGISYSLAYRVTDSLWVPAGIHTAWNFTQNLVFGLPNSGLVSETSVFRLEAAAGTRNLVYDPLFGVEGAVPCMAVTVMLGVLCIYRAHVQDSTGEWLLSYEAQRRETI